MSSHPPAHPETPHSDIFSLGHLLTQYGRAEWAQIARWFDRQSGTAGSRDGARVAELLTGNVGGDITSLRQNPRVQTLLHYLYTLAIKGQSEYDAYFRGTYDRRLAADGTPRGIVRAVAPVYLGIRQEHVGCGKSEDWLNKDAALDFARYVVKVGFQNVHGGKDSTATEFTRHGLRLILAQFDAFHGPLKKDHLEPHDIEEACKTVPAEHIASLLVFLRLKVTNERGHGSGRGIRHRDLTEARKVMLCLEEVLATKMAEEIAAGGEAHGVDKACETAEMKFFRPQAEVMMAYLQHHDIGHVFHLVHAKLAHHTEHEEGGGNKIKEVSKTIWEQLLKVLNSGQGLATLGLAVEAVVDGIHMFDFFKRKQLAAGQENVAPPGTHDHQHPRP